MNFCIELLTTPTAKAVPCQGECMAYRPAASGPRSWRWSSTAPTFYTELPAFRWPARPQFKRTKGTGKGAKEKRALRRATGNGTIDEEM